jgi:SAM-dependent methyltransferase
VVHPVAHGFSAVADIYERARPTYPPEVVKHLANRLDLRRGRSVVDLGAGTGKLTRLLADTGARVVAVEPLAEMRETLERVVPEAESLEGTAEAIPLGDASADAVTAAQSFHWFDAVTAVGEIYRVLRPGGAVGLVWNMRDVTDPLQARLEELLAPLRQPRLADLPWDWQAVVEESPFFTRPTRTSFPWAQRMTRDDLVDRVSSTSFVAQLTEEDRDRLLEDARALVDHLEEPFPFRYRADVYVFRRV